MEFSHKKLNLSCPKNGQSLEQTSYDWLSNLPPDIQLRILSFLNMTEVVKTSFLSRKWRFIWSSIPCLNFDFRDFGNQEHCFALSYDECISKFWVFVKRTIIMRDRDPSPIYKIQFSYDYFNAYLLELLISLCATRNVPELVLVAGFGSKKCPLYCDAPRSINVIAQNLNNLKLEPFTSFGNLKTLHLVRVGFPDTDVTANLFGDCGILENLSIEYCCFMMIKFLNICANKLRTLHFLNNGPSWCRSICRFEGALKLQTPNLESFCYIGPAIHFCEFSDMLFLKHALIRVRCENYQLVPCHKLDTIVSVINDVEELSMSSVFAMYFAIGRCGFDFSPFNNLRLLKLDMECHANHIEGLINLLQISPNLEFLRIKLCQFWKISNWKSREEDVPCLSRNLKEIEVEILAHYDMPESLELIKFFLQNGEALKRMKIIQSKQKASPDKFYALHEVRLASEAVSVSVASTSASGKMEFMHLVFEKCGVSIQTQTRKVKIRLRRSVRDGIVVCVENPVSGMLNLTKDCVGNVLARKLTSTLHSCLQNCSEEIRSFVLMIYVKCTCILS